MKIATDVLGKATRAAVTVPTGSRVRKRARQAHRLKGAASNFALTDFCAHLGRVEAAALAEAGVAEVAQGLDLATKEAVRGLRAAARDAGLQLAESSASM